MKKFGFGRRMLSLLLALTLVLSVVAPLVPKAKAITIAQQNNTGLSSGINMQNSISWPIRLYDYQNDGMLFEFAQATHESINNITSYAYYGGGQPVPQMGVGNDYTLGATFNEYAYKNWGNTSSYSKNYDSNPTEVTREIVQPSKDKNPMYLHLSYNYPVDGNTKSYVWVSNFARDNYTYYNKDEVRYMVMVYKTNDVYAEVSNGIGHAMRPFWAVDDANYSTYAVDISNLTNKWGWNNTGILVGKEQRVPPSTNEWSYFIMDMKTNHTVKNATTGVYEDVAYGIKANWGAETGDTNKRIAGIGISIPICAEGEQMDVSHIAYFSSRKEAEEYAKDALSFNNDPGEYLSTTYNATHSTTNGPDDSARVDPNAPAVTTYGSDFVNTPQSNWDAPFKSWGNAGTGMTLSQLTDNTTKLNYMHLGSLDAADDSLDFANFGTSGVTKENVQYVTIVYKTNSYSAGTMGFWVDGNTIAAGKGARSSSYMQTLPASTTWTYAVYNLANIAKVDSDYNKNTKILKLGWYLPGLNASESLDIAYVDYFNTQAKADTFGASAVSYMKTGASSGNTGGSTGGTTVTTPVEKPKMTGNVLDFTIPAGTTGTSAAGYTYVSGFDDYTYSTWSYDPIASHIGGLTKEAVTDTNGDTRYYTRVSSDNNYNEIVYTFLSDVEASKESVRYVTMVYRTKGFTANKQVSFWVETNQYYSNSIFAANKYTGYGNNNIAYISAHYPDAAQTFLRSENEWTFMTFDLNQLALEDSDYNLIDSFSGIGIYLPGLNTSEKLEIAAIDYYSTEDQAATVGSQLAQYMNRASITTSTGGSGSSGGSSTETVVKLPGSGSVTTTVTQRSTSSKGWNMGDNSAFGFLFSSYGGGWRADGNRGGDNLKPNGYYSYQIGKTITPQSNFIQDTQRPAAFKNLDPRIFLFNLSTGGAGGVVTSGYTDLKGVTRTSNGWTYDTSYMKADGFDLGYTLHTTLVDGLGTMGLVNHTLGSNKNPVYNDATVDYIAYMLYHTLRIPKTDTSGNYNYNFVKGTPSTLFGSSEGESVDLATALRRCLKITFSSNSNTGSTTVAAPNYGDAAKMTAAKKQALTGSFQSCKGNITNFTEAAYYLLNNLYVGNSYNQQQTDYNYLVLGEATVSTNGKKAYVFDGGFTYKDAHDNFVSAVTFDKQQSIITLNYADEKVPVLKDEILALDGTKTTRYPFLPITDSTGDFSGPTVTPYFVDDGARNTTAEADTYVDRNYNFAMAANGEFVYQYDNEPFFQFEGDDDVYLFVNGELVLDIGAGHSITSVEMNLNDYIDDSKKELASLYAKGYYDGMPDADFQQLISSYSAKDQETLTRAHKLNLVDGQSYSFDFYYMERHGWGSNCRIATNIVITDPAMKTDKTAYQDNVEIEYGGIVNAGAPIEYGFSVTNEGNSKLYNIAFEDTDIGLAIDPKQGLVVSSSNVTDASGNTLDPADLTFTVSGYYDEAMTQPTGDINVTVADNEELMSFLHTLESAGTQTGTSKDLFSGNGLWRHATLSVRGIYYTMTDAQKAAKRFDNTVHTSSNPAVNSTTLLTGQDVHRVYTEAAVQYYQWAGNHLYVDANKFWADVVEAANTSGSTLEDWKTVINDLNKSNPASKLTLAPSNSNGVSYTYAQQVTNNTVEGTHFLDIVFTSPGSHLIYVKVLADLNSNGTDDFLASAMKRNLVVPVLVNTTDVKDDVVVLDYGLKANLTMDGGILGNDYLSVPARQTNYSIRGISKEAYEYVNAFTSANKTKNNLNRVLANGSNTTVTFTHTLNNTSVEEANALIENNSLIFKPTGFMEQVYTMGMAVTVYDSAIKTPSALGAKDNTSATIDINNEVQMYQNVTVLPATVVYYEDDFPAINYVTNGSANVFEDLGGAANSENLNQSVDQNTEYGSDPVYDSNSDMSGNTAKKITLRQNGDIAYFTFTGTGFELISRTDADKYATIGLSIYNASDVNQSTGKPNSGATSLQYIPLVTEFDHNGDGGNETIYQVPAIRVDSLTKGTYTVIISGSVSRDWLNKYDGPNNVDWDPSKFDGTEATMPEIIDSYLYIDGLRIYQPLGATNDHYSSVENGATFAELRQLVVNGFAALASYDSTNLTVGSGTHTWTENRNPEEPEDNITMDYAAVDSVDDYLADGPNNEVYMNATSSNTAMVLYVKEDSSSTVHNMQIAVRAVDMGLFLGSASTGMSVDVMYGVQDGENYAWRTVATVTSGTEQYYTIDYTQCPKDADGYYQVAIKVANGMASFTSVKYNGLLIKSNVGEIASVKFVDGLLQKWDATKNAWVDSVATEIPTFLSLRKQMEAASEGSTGEQTPIEPDESSAITATGGSLSFEEKTLMNIYFKGSVLEGVDLADMGLLTWSTAPADGTYENAENVYPGAIVDVNGQYMVQTAGISAKNLGDDIYFRVYAKLADGTYVYSQQLTYSPKTYALNRLENSTSDSMKALCVAMLNYGAAAQKYFGYKTDDLMNASLTKAQQELVCAYSSKMVTPIVKADNAKIGAFAQTEGFVSKYPTVSFEGAFAINYHFTPSAKVDGNMTFYYWTGAAYADADVLTAQNASGTAVMSLTDSGAYMAQVSDIAAKQLNETVYVAAVYESNGTTYCTGVLAYSLSAYFADRVTNGSAAMQDFSAAAAVYGFYAKNYFAQ